MAGFLECGAHAVKNRLDELNRLQKAESNGKEPGRAARSRLLLNAALDVLLRAPLLQARNLAKANVSQQVALGMLRNLVDGLKLA